MEVVDQLEFQTDLSCGSYQARYLVGTHSSSDSDQKYWASRSARSRYVSNFLTYDVINGVLRIWARLPR